MNTKKTVFSGLIGTAVTTGIHNFLKKKVEDAPKIDELGKQVIKKILGSYAPKGKGLYALSIFSDMAINSFLFGLTNFSKRRPILAGSLIGLGIGIATTGIPEKLGFKKEFTSKTARTVLLTVLYYMAGGITSGILTKVVKV